MTVIANAKGSTSRSSRHGVIDSRQNPRVGIDFPVDIYTTEFSGPLPARARDLGIGGVCVATSSMFVFKSIERLVLKLPEATLELQADGCWQHNANADEVVLTGVAFRNLNDEDIEMLWDVVLTAGKSLAHFLFTQSDLHTLALEETLGLSQLTRYRDISAGRTIYRQDVNQPAEDSFFVVIEGTVVLTVRVHDAREVTIDRLGRGRIFGGLPLMSGIPHSESAIAETDLRLLELDHESYRYLDRAKPWLSTRLAQVMNHSYAARLQKLLSHIRDEL